MMTEGRDTLEIASIYRQRVFDPLAEQIRRWARRAAECGELSGDTPQRDPLLLLTPAILATMWNGLYPEEPVRPIAVFKSFLELAASQQR